MAKINTALAGAGAGAAFGPYGAAAGALGGYLLGKDDNSNAAYEEMLKAAQGIPLPILKEQNPELYKAIVSMNPEMENAVHLGPSATEGIALDPAYKQAQMNALAKLQTITDNNGQDATSMAANSRLQNDVNTNLQGNTQAIQQNMATRGMSGSGSDMVAQQMAAQSAANRQAQMGMDINAQAQQRALSALMNQGSMANQMSQTDFGQQNTKANAQDAISKFNTQNLQNVSSGNVQAKNSAQQMNNSNLQNVANKNVDLGNQSMQNNNGLAQQNFNNQMTRIGMQNQAATGAAQNSYNQSRDQDMFLGGVANSAAKYAANRAPNSPAAQAPMQGPVQTNNDINDVIKWNSATGRRG